MFQCCAILRLWSGDDTVAVYTFLLHSFVVTMIPPRISVWIRVGMTLSSPLLFTQVSISELWNPHWLGQNLAAPDLSHWPVLSAAPKSPLPALPGHCSVPRIYPSPPELIAIRWLIHLQDLLSDFNFFDLFINCKYKRTKVPDHWENSFADHYPNEEIYSLSPPSTLPLWWCFFALSGWSRVLWL